MTGSTNGAKQATPSQWLQLVQASETIPCFIWDLQTSRKKQQSNYIKVDWKAKSVFSPLPDWPRTCGMIWMCSKCMEWGKHRARNFSRARFLKTLLSEEETLFVQSTDILNCSQLWDDKGVFQFIILLETKIGLGTTLTRRSVYQGALVMGLHLSRQWHDLSVQNTLVNGRPNIYMFWA